MLLLCECLRLFTCVCASIIKMQNTAMRKMLGSQMHVQFRMYYTIFLMCQMLRAMHNCLLIFGTVFFKVHHMNPTSTLSQSRNRFPWSLLPFQLLRKSQSPLLNLLANLGLYLCLWLHYLDSTPTPLETKFGWSWMKKSSR